MAARRRAEKRAGEGAGEVSSSLKPQVSSLQNGAGQGGADGLSDALAARPNGWSARWRAVVSALLLFHFFAVIVAAMVAAPPSSRLFGSLFEVLSPYINAADLYHGYRFFAPDPGPAHLIRYTLTFADGRREMGTMPDLNVQHPRLLYHRYFMLTEHLFTQFGRWQGLIEQGKQVAVTGEASPLGAGPRDSRAAPSNPPRPAPLEEISPKERADLLEQTAAAEKGYYAMARSYADELIRRTGAQRVSLQLIEHEIPSADDVAAGRPLTDPTLYQPMGEPLTFSADSAQENRR